MKKLIKKFQNPATTLPEVQVTAINPSRFAFGSTAYDYATALNNSRTKLMNEFNLSDQDYTDLSKFALNLAQRESSLGKRPSYLIRQVTPDSVIHLGKMLLRGKDSGNSRGVTQIKYKDDITENENLANLYSKYGIKESNLGTDPEKMAQATIIRAIDVKNQLGNNPYHYTNGETIPQDVSMAMYWNRGKLTDYANPAPSQPHSSDSATAFGETFNKNKIIK